MVLAWDLEFGMLGLELRLSPRLLSRGVYEFSGVDSYGLAFSPLPLLRAQQSPIGWHLAKITY